MSCWVRACAMAAMLSSSSVATGGADELIQITNSPATDMWPTWSPDGQWLVFSSDRTGPYRLYEVPATGGSAVQISFGPGDDNFPAISPDGTKIAFSRSVNHDAYTSIWVMPFSGGDATELSTPQIVPGDVDWYAEWSNDGRIIYFGRRHAFDNDDWGLLRVPAAGGPTTTYLERPFAQINPVLSPDGSMIAYGGRLEDRAPYNVWFSPVTNPTAVTQITSESENTVPTDFSSDGSKLLYVSRTSTGWAELYEMDLTGHFSTRLTFDSDGLQSDSGNQHGIYSPRDQNKIAHYSLRSGNYDIWILDRKVSTAEVTLACPPHQHNRVPVGQSFILSFPFCNKGREPATCSWYLSDQAGWAEEERGTVTLGPGQCHAVTVLRTARGAPDGRNGSAGRASRLVRPSLSSRSGGIRPAGNGPPRGGENTFTFRLGIGPDVEVCEVLVESSAD